MKLMVKIAIACASLVSLHLTADTVGKPSSAPELNALIQWNVPPEALIGQNMLSPDGEPLTPSGFWALACNERNRGSLIFYSDSAGFTRGVKWLPRPGIDGFPSQAMPRVIPGAPTQTLLSILRALNVNLIFDNPSVLLILKENEYMIVAISDSRRIIEMQRDGRFVRLNSLYLLIEFVNGSPVLMTYSDEKVDMEMLFKIDVGWERMKEEHGALPFRD